MTTKSLLSLVDFNSYVAALATHDWHFEYSDDIRVRKAGKAKHDDLTTLADMDAILMQAFSAYNVCAMSSNQSLLKRIEARELTIDRLRNHALNTQLVAA